MPLPTEPLSRSIPSIEFVRHSPITNYSTCPFPNQPVVTVDQWPPAILTKAGSSLGLQPRRITTVYFILHGQSTKLPVSLKPAKSHIISLLSMIHLIPYPDSSYHCTVYYTSCWVFWYLSDPLSTSTTETSIWLKAICVSLKLGWLAVRVRVTCDPKLPLKILVFVHKHDKVSDTVLPSLEPPSNLPTDTEYLNPITKAPSPSYATLDKPHIWRSSHLRNSQGVRNRLFNLNIRKFEWNQ